MSDVGCRMSDVGCRMSDVGCWLSDVGCRMLADVGCGCIAKGNAGVPTPCGGHRDTRSARVCRQCADSHSESDAPSPTRSGRGASGTRMAQQAWPSSATLWAAPSLVLVRRTQLPQVCTLRSRAGTLRVDGVR
eukprot:1121607-Rhodomonas_salina.1